MRSNSKNTAIIISADIKPEGYRFLALKNIIDFYESKDIYVALLLRGVSYDFAVDLQVNAEHTSFFTKEKDWNYMIDKLPESIKYIFFSDADCLEVPGQDLIKNAVDSLEEYELDGLHCFSDIIYLSEYATQRYYKTGEIVNDFTHKKSGSNGGWASGGLLLFKREYIEKVRFIDYCWLGAGDTINMMVFMSETVNSNFAKIWNSELLEDVERRKRHGIRFGRLNATLMHLFHRSPEFDFNKFRRMFYGQITKPDIDFNEKLGEPYIEWVEQIKQYQKYIRKDMRVIDLIDLFHELRESSDEVKFPFLKHKGSNEVVLLSDSYPIKVLKKMNYLTEEEFRKIEEKDNYFKGRWEYFKEVIEMAKEIAPQKVLEIGAVGCKLVKNSKVVDFRNEWQGVKYDVDYLLDITKDLDQIKERFDLIICLQVFEHLEDSQQKVFKALLDKTDNLIISVPYLWSDKKDLVHYNITDDVIKEWTDNKVPKKEIIKGDYKKRKILKF